jgi:hypothetical protein
MPSPPLVVPNAVQVRLLNTFAGNLAVNVLHGRKTAGAVVGQALADTLGAAIKSAFTSNMGPVATTNSAVLKVGVRDLTTANQPEYIDQGAAAGGTDLQDPLPPGTCICISLVCALTGKSFRGRVYVGGFSEAANDATGAANAAAEAGALNFVAGIQAAMLTSGLALGVLSRPAYAYQDIRTWQLPEGAERQDVIGNGKARTGGITDVISLKSNDVGWETQRRRQNGRGNAAALMRLTPMVVLGEPTTTNRER